MFDLFIKPKFHAKCKSAIRMIKMRLETIKKKRKAVEKYLKNDIAELLSNSLDYNAYGRAEGLLIEQNRTTCYNFVEQFSEYISKHLSVMQKQSECPEECREAIPSLKYAAARFADLPELRDLRTIFTERYGHSLESFVNQEFVQKLRAETPTKEMKLQLLHDIAQEFSIEWDSKALEQKLFKPPPPQQNEAQHKSLNEADDDGYKLYRSKNDTFQKSDGYDQDGFDKKQKYSRPKRNETDLTSQGRKEESDEKHKLHSSSTEDEETDQDFPRSCSSAESVSEEGIENRKPFYYRFIPPPNVKPSLGEAKNSMEEATTSSDNSTDNQRSSKWDSASDESKAKPRSVRRRPLKPAPGREGLSSDENKKAESIRGSSAANQREEARKDNSISKQTGEISDERDEEEKIMDGLLMHYSKKKSPYELTNKSKANLKLPGSEGLRFRGAKSDPPPPPPPPGRAAAAEETSPTEKTGMRGKASMEPNVVASHVHPKLPEYDDLAARLAALRGRS